MSASATMTAPTSAQKRQIQGPAVVLCSRGLSFMERMDEPVKWAIQNGIRNVVLLHCPESKWSEAFVHDVRERAERLFGQINARLRVSGERELTFELVASPAPLHDAIASMTESGDIRVVFVGMSMLDYRLSEIKKLKVPFYFIGNEAKRS